MVLTYEFAHGLFVLKHIKNTT